MNLRQNDSRPKIIYHYVIFYNFWIDDRFGSGMSNLSRDSCIDNFSDLLTLSSKIEESLKLKYKKNVKIVLTNYQLLKTTGNNNGTKCREEKTSSENDTKISEGS